MHMHTPIGYTEHTCFSTRYSHMLPVKHARQLLYFAVSQGLCCGASYWLRDQALRHQDQRYHGTDGRVQVITKFNDANVAIQPNKSAGVNGAQSFTADNNSGENH